MLTVSAEAATAWLHVEQNPQASGFWQEIAAQVHGRRIPGVKVEMQYLENEAYKKKLTTLLQSPDRPNIIYSWGGGVLREQVKAGVIEDLIGGDERPTGANASARRRCRPTRWTARSTACRC